MRHGDKNQWQLEEYRAEPERSSLEPTRYRRVSKTWITVTPMAFDRHPKREGEAERIVVRSCRSIGLPEPSSVEISRGSPFRGAADSREYRVEGRMLRHLALTFDQAVRGPVLLGAGRYRGLGLCLPA